MAIHTRAAITGAGALLLSALLGGCSLIPWLGSEEDPTPPSELPELDQSLTPTTLWSARVTDGTDGRRLYLVPTLAAGRLYVADARGTLAAVAADNGRVLWRQETELAFSGGPEVHGERLVLGTTGGELALFSTADGSELWRTRLGSEVLSVPRFADAETIVVHTLDDSLYGIEAATGEQRWHLTYPAPVLTLRGSSTPAVAPDGVIVGLSGGKLIKFDVADGTPLWEVTITRPSGRSELSRIADIDADPVLVGTTVFVGTYNGDLAAVDAVTGTVLWRRELSAHAGLAATPEALFVTDSRDQVWGADPLSGAGRWVQEALRYRRLTAPALLGQVVAVGDLEGYVHLLDAADGQLLGRTRVTKKAPITAPPLAAAGRLYVYADDGTLSALSVGAIPARTAQRAPEQADNASP